MIRYFNYEPSTLVIKLSNQNTQDLKKNLGKIKEQKIKLDKGERNSTKNKNQNDRFNMILSLIDRIYQFFEYKFLSKPDKQPGHQQRNQNLRLWVMSIDHYTELKSNVNKYYETNFTYSADNKKFNLNNLENFLISVNNQQATKERAKAFLMDTILKEIQEVVNTNPRGQKNGKKLYLIFIPIIILNIYTWYLLLFLKPSINNQMNNRTL